MISARTVRERAEPAEIHWEAAVRAFDPYPDRLRDLADAADEQAQVLRMAELAAIPWTPRPGSRDISLADGLEPGERPGPPELWKQFDEEVRALGLAMEGSENRAVYEAFERLRDELDVIADSQIPQAQTEDDEAQTG
jgi:hypothetical protein